MIMQARVLTDEIRKKLLGFNPVSQEKGIAFTPEHYLKDPDLKPFAPVFRQRPWTQNEMNEMQAVIQQGQFTNDTMKEMARVTVLGFENLLDLATGQEIEFAADDRGAPRKDVFQRWPAKLQFALFYHAQAMSGLKAEDKESLGS
jgi:hypothetical protein